MQEVQKSFKELPFNKESTGKPYIKPLNKPHCVNFHIMMNRLLQERAFKN